MKFVCLGYADLQQFAQWSSEELNHKVDECLSYDDELRRSGHFVCGHALKAGDHAVTLRYQDQAVVTVDGPFAETKEQLGGILILEARDMNHAIQLMSKHPGVKMGPFEIRPADMEFEAFVAEREEKISQASLSARA